MDNKLICPLCGGSVSEEDLEVFGCCGICDAHRNDHIEQDDEYAEND